MNSAIENGFIIAIDGPVASGKGTIAPQLAEVVGGFYMNTGGLFRMIALYANENDIPLEEAALLEAYPRITLDLDEKRNVLNGQDVSDRLNGPRVSQASSIVASITKVHEQVIFREREIANAQVQAGKIVIAEGRNTATAVFPDAALKIFMTADVKTRAQRRYNQALERGDGVDLETVIEDTKARDDRDRLRAFSPMVDNPEEHGYYLLDNSRLTEEETLRVIVKELQERKLIHD